MASKQTRLIALLLVASLFMNTVVLPVKAAGTEGSSVITETPAETSAGNPDTHTDETEETEETVEAVAAVDEDALLAAQQSGYQRAVDYYQSLPISDERTMPLEWWYVMTESVSMREPDYAVLEDAELAAQALEDAETSEDWSAFLVFPESISVGGGADLILLSYVSPREYQDQTIVIATNGETEYLLSQPIDVDGQTLSYLGLGGLDAPFEGIIRFDEHSEEIAFVLNSHLFIGLSNKARFLNGDDQINPVTLISEATLDFDGLLAQHILGERGDTANWDVVLSAPAPSDSADYYLPSVLGVLYGNTNVNLTLTDNSDLEPSARGYLCAVMYPDACLDAKNITREISAPLVGELSEKATLVTDIPQPEETQPAEEPEEEEEYEPADPSAYIPVSEDGTLKFYADMPEKAFQKIVDYYVALPVVSGEMPLEWWFAVCGKLEELHTYLTWRLETELERQEAPAAARFAARASTGEEDSTAADETAAFLSEIAPITNEVDFFNYEKVTGALDKGHVWNFAKRGDNPVFDMTIDGVSGFDGIGAADKPFQGILNVVDGDGVLTFKLNRALFGGIATTANTATGTTLVLQTALTSGNTTNKYLFADNVVVVPGETSNSASWSLTVKKGDDEGSGRIPSLIGTIQNGADVTLNVDVENGLPAEGQAFLCTQMQESSSLTYSCSSLPVFTPSGSPAGTLVGTMKDGSQVNFTATGDVKINTTTTASGAGTFGGLVGEMGKGTQLTVNAGSSGSITIDVVNTKGDTGGLVGKQNKNATLTVNTPISIIQVKGKQKAGGLVADAYDPIFQFAPGVSVSGATGSSKTITKSEQGGSCGGIAAKVTIEGNNLTLGASPGASVHSIVPVQDLTISYGDSGGLFGEVANNGGNISIDYNGVLVDDVTLVGRSKNQGGGACGGLIGWYSQIKGTPKMTVSKGTAINITAANTAEYMGGYFGNPQGNHDLTLSGSITFGSINNIARFGGVIGGLQNTSYVNFNNLTVTFGTGAISGSSVIDNYGGLVGTAVSNGDLIHLGANVNLSGTTIFGTASAGGLIGQMDHGAVYMESYPSLPSEAQMLSTNIAKRGWILGNRGNALVCSADTRGWTAHTAAETNDTGLWGQVLDLSRFEPGLVTVTDGKLTVGEISNTDNEYVVNSVTDFAKVALRIQLDSKDKMSLPSDITKGTDVKIRLTGDINLEGTGLTGLTRDNTSGEQFNITITGDKAGGSQPKITLPNTLVHAVRVNDNINDNHHNRQGLINKVGTLNLENLIVDGNPKVNIITNNYIYSAIVNELNGNGSLKNVTSSVVWTITNKVAAQGRSDVSGFICKMLGSNSTLTFEDCIWNGQIQDNTYGDTYTAGFLCSDHDKTVQNGITFTDCTVSGTINKIRKEKEAKAAGLITNLNSTNTLTLNNLTVDNTTITTAKNTEVEKFNPESSGGLLGYSWKCEKVEFNGVTIKGSTLYAGTAKFGGLVHSGSGYWKVPEGETVTTDEGETTAITNGGIFIKNTTFTGGSEAGNGTPSGLLVRNGNGNPGLYLEVGDYTKSYIVDGKTVQVTLTSNPAGFFDELVGRSKSNGVVSIGTANHAPIDQNGRNTYTHQLTGTYQNPQTRYYYNLDHFRGSDRGEGLAASSPIDSAEKMVLLSAWNSCASNLQKYFYSGTGEILITNPINPGETDSKILNLEGYSYYPIAFRSGMKIQDATIKFNFEQLEQAESEVKSEDPAVAKEENKKPSEKNRQHAEMHTGIFYEAKNNGTEDITFRIDGLTLQGNVGKYNQCGAIIRGQVAGKSAEAMMRLDFKNINLDGIKVYGFGDKDFAPLLIDGISSYSDLNLNGVTTIAGRYDSGVKAGSSLIGNVGDANAQYIHLTFSKIMLNENKNEDCSLFTRALFLQKFQYNNNTCSGVYNFVQEDPYTLGKELSNTTTGRNRELQYWFFKEQNQTPENYICTLIRKEDNNPATAFSGFTPYVAEAENDKDKHELDINLLPTDLVEGCGTYSHPYVIRSGAQLNALAVMLRGRTKNGWKVKVDKAVYAANANFSAQNSHTFADPNLGSANNESELEAETVYEYNGSSWSGGASDDTLRNYLRSAYYVIKGEIPEGGTNPELDLGNGWVGLGEANDNQQFRGVIVGWDDNQIIKIGSATTQQFGGLIKFSQGSVVKNLTIEYTGNISITAAGSDGDLLHTPAFFGGVVGWCLGGDTIIDGVTVRTSDGGGAITAADKTGWPAAVGGYVGLVGGASGIGGGGVVFRGTLNNSLTIPGPEANYHNEAIGRVLDGYALSETNGIGSTDKNYKVPYLPIGASFGLETNGSGVVISNENGLWILSAMVNSQSGGAGKGRYCQYDNVGKTADPGDELADEQSSRSYLFLRHGFTLPANMRLNFIKDCDMLRTFGNGFRGIGVSHGILQTSEGDTGYSVNVYPVISRLNGDGHTVTLDQSVSEPAGQSSLWSRLGAGLFPVMRGDGTAIAITDLKLAGTIYFANGYAPSGYPEQFTDFGSAVGVGMLAGRILTGGNVTCTNVEVGGTVTAKTVSCVGGLIGYSGDKAPTNTDTLTFENCKYNNLTVSGLANVGSLVGYACADSIRVTDFTGNTGSFSSEGTSTFALTAIGGNNRGIEGVGSLIGLSLYADFTASDINLNGFNISATGYTANTMELGLGGLVGILLGDQNEPPAGDTVHVSIHDVTIGGKVSLTTENGANTTVGGIIGFLSDPKMGDWNGTYEMIAELNNIHIADGNSESLTITGKMPSALVGQFKGKQADSDKPAENYQSSLGMTNIFIGSETSPVSVTGVSFGGSLLAQVLNSAKITVDGVTLQNNAITVTGGPAALIIASQNNSAGTANIRSVYAKDCNVSGTTSQGFVYGNLPSRKVNGYNILVRDSQLTGTAEITGIFGGSNNNNTGIQFVAVNAIGCTIPEGTQDFGSTTTDRNYTSYAIRANFTMAENEIGPKPYMPVSPASGIGTLTIGETSTPITGDGASFCADTTDAVTKAIAGDTNETYFNVSEQQAFFATGDGANMISDYLTSSDSDLEGSTRDNFPVLVIPAEAESKVTDPIVKYLSLLTNQNEDFGWWKDKVDIYTFQWVNNAYQQTDATLKKTTTGFQVTPGGYDNQKDQFTLLDVRFEDPTGSGGFFHLYVPIIVQKLMEFKFWASVHKDTIYNADSYADFKDLAIGSHGEQFTALIGYQLLYDENQWQTLVDNQENLLWNFQRIIRLDAIRGGLPAGTKLTLVDRNDGNRAYFKETNSALRDDVNLEELFGWTPRYICDLLPMTAIEDETGTYVQTDSNDERRTLRIGDQYYRPATSNDESGKLYKISVTGRTKEESFFLTIQTQSGSDLSNFYFTCAPKLPYSDQVKGLPTRLLPHATNRYFAKNEEENHLIIGDFLQQSFEVVDVTTEENMSFSTTKQLSATLKMTITKTPGEQYQQVYNSFASSKKLYPQFDLFFRDTDTQIKPIPQGTILNVTYKKGTTTIGEAEPRNLDEVSMVRLSGFPEGIPATEIGDELVIQAEVTLTYDDEGIRQQFPVRSTQGVEGVMVNGYSYLSYSPTILSGAPSQDVGNRSYYRQVVDVATLTYTTAIPDEAQEPVGQLGINGLHGDSFDISSIAYYSAATLKAAAEADSMKCELKFYPKDSNSEYSDEDVDVPYDASFQIELDGQTLKGNQDGIISFDQIRLNPDTPVTIHIPLTIDTGSKFEGTYSNYKVKLRVSLLKDGKEIEGSSATDYIIYTNAKILTTLVRD